MNPRNTWILVALASGLFAFIYFFESRIKAPAPVVALVLPGIKASEVTSIQIQPMNQDMIRAERTNGVWRLTKPVAFAAQSLAVDGFLEALQGLSPHRWISAEELKDKHRVEEEYGFDTPQATIMIQQGDEQRILKLGHSTSPGDEVFAQVVGMEGIEVIGADFVNKFVPREANDWRDTAFANLKGLTFDRLTVTSGTKMFELQRETNSGLWHIAKDKPMLARADNFKIIDLLFKLHAARVTQFETDDPKADLESLGLQSPELELSFSEGTNRALLLQFGKSPTNDASQVYARRNGESAIVLVPRELISPWRGDYTAFRDRRLASLNFGPPDAIDVEVNGGEKFSVYLATNGGWQVTDGKQTNVADLKLVRDFIEDLARLEVAPVDGQFAVKDVVTKSDLTNVYGLAPPALRYVLRQTGTNSAGTTNPVVAELDFSGPGPTNYACRGDLPEESSVYEVRRSDVEKLPTSSLQLRARRIWSFDASIVTAITIKTNGVANRFGHSEHLKWEVLAGSLGIIEPIEMEAGVEDLGELEAETWIDSGDQNRARYGFTDSSPRIILDLKSGDKKATLTLDFGGLSPRGHRIAATQLEGQTWFFELSPKAMDRLSTFFKLFQP